MSLVMSAFFFYPFWGLALLWWFCGRLSVCASIQVRLLVAALVGALGALVFSPAMWGAEGFAFMVPWYLVFVDRANTVLGWQLVVPVFVLAFTINLLRGRQPGRWQVVRRTRGT